MPPPWSAAERDLRLASGEYDEYFDVPEAGTPTRNLAGVWYPTNSIEVVIPSDDAIGAWCELTPTGIVLTYGVKFAANIQVAHRSPDTSVSGTEFTGYTFNGEPFDEDGQPRHSFPLDGAGEPITEWPAGTHIDFWGSRSTDDGPGPIRLLVRLQINGTYDPGPPEPPDSGVGADDGIYVGTIVLADPVSGLYHYTDGDLPCATGPGSWADAYENTLWQGSRDGLAPSTGGFTRRRVRETGGGAVYPYLCTPLFAVENTTSRVSLFLYDGVGDFYDIAFTRYVASGETIFGNVYIPNGFGAAFVVGDDAAPDGQAVLAGSFWLFPA